MSDTIKTPDHETSFADNLALLCARYDGLLDLSGSLMPTTEALGELTAMAGIFDLATDRPASEIWHDLRAVLVRQVPETGDVQTDAPFVANPPLTLMLVEDDAAMAEDLMEVLTEAGHRVVGPFHNAEAAEVSAALHAFDMALLDINLSGDQTGVDLAQSLKSRWGVPVMFLSGDVTATAAHAKLAEAIVLKPYTGRDVLSAIDRVAALNA